MTISVAKNLNRRDVLSPVSYLSFPCVALYFIRKEREKGSALIDESTRRGRGEVASLSGLNGGRARRRASERLSLLST